MKAALTVLPLGPGDPSLLTLQSAEALQSGKPVFLRTGRHPVSAWLKEKGIPFSTFDELYESSETFEEMNLQIARLLLEKAREHPVIYAVPDPTCDTSVSLLLREAESRGIPVALCPGVSIADACLAACGAAADRNQIQILPAADFISGIYHPSLPVLITEVDSALLAGEVKLKLSDYDEECESDICFLPPSEALFRQVRHIPLQELDRQKKYDQTAAVYVPGRDPLARKRFTFQDLEYIMERLRARDGCPWDQAQTHSSLRPYLVEEAWEAVDAIDAEDTDHLADELGDVLLQVVFHTSIAAACEEFSMTDVLTHICRKMIIRHPHLFPDAAVLSSRPQAVSTDRDWEKIKRAETGSRTVGESLNDVSASLPALKYAAKVHKKLDQWPGYGRKAAEVADSLRQAADSLMEGTTLREDRMALLLLEAMDLCRLCGTDGEILLHGAVNRMKERWQGAEKLILSEGKRPEALTASELRAYLSRSAEQNENLK